MFHRLICLIVVPCVVLNCLARAHAQEVPRATEAEAAAPDFNTHIAPIFKTYCQGCHNADAPEGKLVLESYESLLGGGASGSAIAAGKADESRLLLVLDGRAEPKMPPEGSEAPTADEIALIKAWIMAGAKSPTGAAPDPTLLITPQVEPLGTPRQVVNAAALSADGQTIALAGYRTTRLISAASRGLLREFAEQRGNVTDVRFSNDGMKLITAAGEPGIFGEAKLWNVADGKLLQTFLGHTDSLYAAVLSPDGAIAATAGYDQTIKLWDTASGKELRTLLGHNGAVFDLSFSPDGRILASASADRTVKLWDVASGERLDTLSQSFKEIYTVSFSPDGKQIVAAGADNRLRIWQVSATAKEGSNPLVITRFAHDGAVIKLKFSPDGKLLVSSADDRSVKLWETTGYSEYRRLEDQADWAPALAFAGDGKSVLVGRLDGGFALYQTETGQPVPPAKPELTAVSPRGWQAGTGGILTLQGKNLLGVSVVNFSTPHLTGRVLPQDTATPDHLQVELSAAADAPRAAVQLSVQTAGGTSNAVPVYVDGIVQVAETEPNANQGSATALALPAGVWGVLDARGDVDHYSFDAVAGQTLVVEVAAKRFGSTINAVLTVLSPTGQVVASNNDYDGAEDPLVAYTAPVAGRYTVRVSDLTLTGAATHFYRLSVGPFAFVTGSFPMSVAANTEAEVELTGYNLPAGEKSKVMAAAAGEAEVPIDAMRFRTRQPIKVIVAAEPQLVEVEPNATVEQGTVMPAPGVMGGRITDSADADLFRFEAQAGQTWIVEVDAARRGSPIDPKVEVLDAQGQPVVRLLLQAVRESYIDFRPMDSSQPGFRSKDFEEMDLNQFVYLQGEVGKIFRMPQGPDSDILLYTLAGRRRCYFDTSSTAHAFEEPFYIVEPHPTDAQLVSNGLPIFPVYYVNDDDADRRLGRDSRVFFTAPASGSYCVRVSDVRGFGGDRFTYRLLVRQPQPDFRVALHDPNPSVARGSGRRLTFGIERTDGFEGDVTVQISNLPPGISTSAPVVIEAGHQDARAVLVAAADAPQPTEAQWQAVKIDSVADIQGKSLTHAVNALGKITVTDKPNLLVTLEPAELTIAPGTTITATLKVERNGFNELVQFDVDNLPHGVIVDNIGLNGVLIPAGESERQIFLTASKGVGETSRRFHAVATNAGAQASAAIMLHVRRPSPVAQAATVETTTPTP